MKLRSTLGRTCRSLIITAALAITAVMLVPRAPAQFLSPQENSTVLLDSGRVIIGNAAGYITNLWVDTHGMAGQARINLSVMTNSSVSSTLTASIETSNDGTNPIAFGSYSLATQQAVNYTNRYYPTAFTVTNQFLPHGTITTPTAATAGWGTPYLLPATFTNSGSVTPALNGVTQIAYNVQDAPRYVRVIWQPGGSITNLTCSAILNARKANFP